MPRLKPSITPPSPRCKVFTWVLSTPEIRGGLKNELIRERLMMHVAQVSRLNGYDRFKIIKTNGDRDCATPNSPALSSHGLTILPVPRIA